MDIKFDFKDEEIFLVLSCLEERYLRQYSEILDTTNKDEQKLSNLIDKFRLIQRANILKSDFAKLEYELNEIASGYEAT